MNGNNQQLFIGSTNQIQQYNFSTNIITPVFDGSAVGSAYGSDAQLSNPGVFFDCISCIICCLFVYIFFVVVGLAVDKQSNLFVVDSTTSLIRRITYDGKFHVVLLGIIIINYLL